MARQYELSEYEESMILIVGARQMGYSIFEVDI